MGLAGAIASWLVAQGTEEVHVPSVGSYRAAVLCSTAKNKLTQDRFGSYPVAPLYWSRVGDAPESCRARKRPLRRLGSRTARRCARAGVRSREQDWPQSVNRNCPSRDQLPHYRTARR